MKEHEYTRNRMEKEQKDEESRVEEKERWHDDGARGKGKKTTEMREELFNDRSGHAYDVV